MKYLIVILVVLLVLWLVRSQQRPRVPPAPKAPAPPPSNEPIVACMQCGLHLPRGEALPGRGGVFCGEAHRADYEKAHPPS